MRYQDSDTTFLARLTFTQSPSHEKNNPVEIHTQSHSSVEDIHFLRYSKGILVTAFEAPASQGEGPWHQATAKESLLETKTGRGRNAAVKGREGGIQLHSALGDTHLRDRNLGS